MRYLATGSYSGARVPFLPIDSSLPPELPIDRRLVAGAAVFGVGWGLAGFCPGPAIVSLPLGAPGTLVFVPAMLIGIAAAAVISGRQPDGSIHAANGC